MAIRKGNVIVAVNLPPYHKEKLDMICGILGVSKSELVKRLIEQYDIFNGFGKEVSEDGKAK